MAELDEQVELAWAAGLFEGEGCFTINHIRQGKPRPCVKLSMTDQDVVERFARVMGVGTVVQNYPPHTQKNGWKPQWIWRIQASQDCIAVIDRLLPYLGERRKTRALEVRAVAATFKSKQEFENVA